MIRDAIYFGLWAAICLLLTAAAFFGVLPPLLDNPYFMKLFALMAMLTAAVAGLGWFVMHRDGTRQSWRGCAGLAASTVVVSHIIIHSVGYYIFVEENIECRQLR